MSSGTTHWARRVRSGELTRTARIRTEVLGDEALSPVDVSTDDLASGRRLSVRLTSAAVRRVWRAIDSLRRSPPAAEAALDWLARSLPVDGADRGLAACSGQFDPCPGLTAGVLATMAAYGQLPIARRLAAWLERVQLDSGAFPDAGLRRASATTTAQAAQGLLGAAGCLRDRDTIVSLDRMSQRACAFLAGLADRHGTSCESSAAVMHEVALSRVAWVAPALVGARRFGRSEWRTAAERVCRHDRSLSPTACWQVPLHLLVPDVEALVEIGQPALARTALAPLNAAQRRDGAVPAVAGATWVSTTGLAHLATVWYRLGEHERADRALDWLRRRQQSSGGFLGSYGRGACYYPRREVAWAAKHFLDASQLQVEASFADGSGTLPARIGPADGRLRVVTAWCAALDPGARIADVGCGRGRYLRGLSESLANLQWCGVDPSAACLAALPPGVETIRGGLLNLPLDDGCCDAAMAIESLEHCLLPERGVSELCRIVRPGGRVLIIDKQRSHQPLSCCQPWERWFTREEVSGWLAAHCDGVKCAAIPHAAHLQPTGLFLCWTAVKR